VDFINKQINSKRRVSWKKKKSANVALIQSGQNTRYFVAYGVRGFGLNVKSSKIPLSLSS